MIPTPTDEVRAIRRELAAGAGYDIHRIAEDARQRQRESGAVYLSLPPCAPQPVDGLSPPRPRTGAA